jgi:hypothetical protein
MKSKLKGFFCDAEVKNMEMLNPLEFCQDFVSRRGEEIRPSSFWDAKGILTGFTLGILTAFGVLKFFNPLRNVNRMNNINIFSNVEP